jgi:invasion protein IalB
MQSPRDGSLEEAGHLKGSLMPFSLKSRAMAGLAGCLMVLAGGQAYGQTKKPAAPAQPAPAQPQQPPGPITLLPTQNDWTKVCGKDQAANKEICYTTRDFSAQAEQAPVLALAVYEIKGEDMRIVRLLMPVGLMLRPGFRFSVDKGEAQAGGFEICFPNGCFAEAKVKGSFIGELKKGTNLNVSVKNQVNNEITFAVPLSGFAKAYDGPPVDPKVLEEQQKKLQEELQKRAEEERKRLEAAKEGAKPDAKAAPAKK